MKFMAIRYKFLEELQGLIITTVLDQRNICRCHIFYAIKKYFGGIIKIEFMFNYPKHRSFAKVLRISCIAFLKFVFAEYRYSALSSNCPTIFQIDAFYLSLFCRRISRIIWILGVALDLFNLQLHSTVGNLSTLYHCCRIFDLLLKIQIQLFW